MTINTRVLPGFMELLPQEQLEFDRIRSIVEEEYQRYGFTPLDTPDIERSEALLAKAGGETEKQIYRFTKGDSDLSLRFDLTVPLARYVAEHYNDLVFPFRRSHIGKVHRGERPQRGRFREFYQCDIDVIGQGTLDIAYDAEIPSAIYAIFSRLNFGKFTIKVNNRKILTGLMEHLGVSDVAQDVLRTIDKIEKISRDELIATLGELGINDEKVQLLLDFVAISGDPETAIRNLRNLGIDVEQFTEGVNELETVTSLMATMGIGSEYFAVDLSIARGLDYYTGTIYETTLDEHPGIGSVCSGGRYDDLASHYTEQKLPGVGISIGLTRLFYQLSELGLIKVDKKTVADVLVIPFASSLVATSLNVAMQLRQADVRADILLEEMPVKKRFRYADKIGVPFVIVVGKDEAATGNFTLQDMTSGNKEKLTVDRIVQTLTER
jgi:histidyl-tRNA synthetase